MQTFARVYQMHDHIRTLDREGIRGALVETGCWKGGLGAYMALSGRETWLFDSFEGLPPLTEKDREIASLKGLPFGIESGYIAVSEEHVRTISRKLGVNPHIVKGWFSDTLPASKEAIGPIAILRLDGDTYSSTLEALQILYDSVVEGGFVVVDDFYDFEGCRLALQDFFREADIAPALHEYPNGRAYFRKTPVRRE
jgi:O-methyltransferase